MLQIGSLNTHSNPPLELPILKGLERQRLPFPALQGLEEKPSYRLRMPHPSLCLTTRFLGPAPTPVTLIYLRHHF